ncbi:MAG: KamA family radical SAM protein [Candidatus Sumerlaeia bacterium]|nr:KamA family radical SAM protein [Candidatus Sumerlaeia bacterium]
MTVNDKVAEGKGQQLEVNKSASGYTDKPDLRHRQLRGGEFWKKIPAYANIPEELFNDHSWQLKHSITSVDKLLDTLRDIVSREFYDDAKAGFAKAPMAVRVSPYALALMNWDDPCNDPIRRQFIPLASHSTPDHPELHLDTLNEQNDSPVFGLTHRYPDKALFLALDICPVYCRYCTRSYAVGFDTEEVAKVKLAQDEKRYQRIFEYIRSQPQLEDIVISGGDAYMLRPSRIRLIGDTLLDIPHVQRLRFATKGPAIMPMKLLSDHEWYDALRAVVDRGRKLHKEVVVHTHFSHPDEITEISKRAMDRLMEDGITVRNQAVLQRGVNDDPATMILLTRRLSYINVHPYYIYMHDLVKGVEDLRTSVQVGVDIEKAVRGATAGFNTPNIVVDAPGGGGKRVVHSYEHYDRETGISVYTAPSVKAGRFFLYFDPFDQLAPDIQAAWRDEKKRNDMKQAALAAAKKENAHRVM